MSNQGTPVYDAMGNFTGVYDPSTGSTEPSPEIAKPAEIVVPNPAGGPIIVAAQIKLGKWTIYAEGEKLFAKSPAGKKLQFEMFDPDGVTQDSKPNKLSDGSDHSSGESIGNTEVTGRTVPGAAAEDAAAAAATAGSGLGNLLNTVASALALAAEIAAAVNFIKSAFSSNKNNTGGKAAAESYLGRAMSDQDWNNLVAITYADAGPNPQEQAWVMGTILNRSRQSGLNVLDIINQPGQYVAVTGNISSPEPNTMFSEGPSAAAEDSIISAAVNLLSSVPTNNYYYNALNPAAERVGDCSAVTQRGGIEGVLVGQRLVYPGAKWP